MLTQISVWNVGSDGKVRKFDTLGVCLYAKTLCLAQLKIVAMKQHATVVYKQHRHNSYRIKSIALTSQTL